MIRLALILALALAGCTSFDDMTERHIAPLPDDPGGAAVDALFTPTGGKNRKP